MSERPDPGDERILELYRRAPRPEPPERLDTAIRAAARAAVRRPHRQWLLSALATAAVLVLAVNLVLERPALQDTDAGRARPRDEMAAPETPKALESPEAQALPSAVKAAPLRSETKRERAAMPPPPAPRALDLSPGGSPEPLAREPIRYRMKDRECPPLPPELASDRALLERQVAELLGAGLRQEAECLLLQLDGLPPGGEE
ncbi:MAG: hypothetical protein KA217_01820 [Gammaproteobacteria bacterium]|nr:hypothetical protein [Gammaproteobacteria bacterium]